MKDKKFIMKDSHSLLFVCILRATTINQRSIEEKIAIIRNSSFLYLVNIQTEDEEDKELSLESSSDNCRDEENLEKKKENVSERFIL